MSVVSNPLIGASKQKMGNAVFSTWKGINVLKTKPLSVANPRSDKQLMHRSALAQMNLWFRNMPSAIDAGFKKLAIKMSPWNAFASYNLKNAFDYTAPPAATIDATLVLISKGTIASTVISTVVADRSANTIVVTFPTSATGAGQSADDNAIICAFNNEQVLFTGSNTSDLRSSGTASIALPADWNVADTLNVYLGFYNQISGSSSDSQNTTTSIVA